MLWLRGLVFTVLVPGSVSAFVPYLICQGNRMRGGLWNAGWLFVALGAAIYGSCLIAFLRSGGTPAIFFTRPLRFVIGHEPSKLVRQGIYRVSRNPMYLGVLLVVFGQALLFASRVLALYGILLWLCFHVVIVMLEEPHLRRERGQSYEAYCSRIPRWINFGMGSQRDPQPRAGRQNPE